MTRKKIALDCDGVLLNFWDAVCRLANKPSTTTAGSWYLDWIKPIYEGVKYDYSFWSSLNPLYPDSANIDFEFDIYLTAIPEEMQFAREENLLNLGFPKKPVIISDDKWKYCKDHGIFALVDDRPSTCKEFVDNWKEEGDPISIQFLPPYVSNEWPVYGHYSIRNLKDIKRFNFIKNGS